MTQSCNYLDAHVGDRIRRSRVFRDVSLGDAAAAAGLTVHELKAREDGFIPFSEREILHIAQALSVPIRFFFQGLSLKPKRTPQVTALRPSQITGHLIGGVESTRFHQAGSKAQSHRGVVRPFARCESKRAAADHICNRREAASRLELHSGPDSVSGGQPQ